jgi:peptide/nickel transport system substrate-binding protein
MYIGMNQKDKFSSTPGGRALRNPAVRLALQYAIDVPTICSALLRTPC